MSADVSMLDLFRLEAEGQGQALVSGLLGLEQEHGAPEHLDACMRAAHSLKGAARIVGLNAGVDVAHALEDCFVAAQAGTIVLGQAQIDRLLEGVELLLRIAKSDEHEVHSWEGSRQAEIEACRTSLRTVLEPNAAEQPLPVTAAQGAVALTTAAAAGDERVVRVTAESFNRLFGLASDSLIKGRWVAPFSSSLARLKRLHQEASKSVDRVRDGLPPSADEHTRAALAEAQRQLSECQQLLADRLVALDWFDRRAQNGLQRLYDEALACRMRPFRDGAQPLPLLVRTVARSLGKRVTLRIEGEGTQVDRDLLSRLDAPLGHLLRNAIDHGIESPEERRAAGKPEEGTLRLEARHSAGRLHITLSDDGRGVDLEALRTRIVARHLINAEAAQALSEAELLEFLFLPGFTLKNTVSDISGRGVGLDAVRDMVTQVRGTVKVTTTRGAGTQFRLQLPVTLSVLRGLIADIGGEPYAFPLSAVTRALQLPIERVARLEGRRHFDLDGRRVGLVSAHLVLDIAETASAGDTYAVVVVGEGAQACGVIVDRFLGERELVVQPLDPLLGKIKDISAGALLDDGAPVLIVDVEDLLRSIAKLASDGRLVAPEPAAPVARQARKRVLIVDDSLTVRELERKLLLHHGYDVDVAVDGMDGWNAVREGGFDLVVTDVDMPRMDGIELVSLITRDPQLRSTPVMIVSYKDREEDRRRGLEAGAASYLTKGSFHDETLVQAVVDLIGEARVMKIGIVDEARRGELLKRAILIGAEHEVSWLADSEGALAEQCAATVPDLVLVNVDLRSVDGLAATRRLVRDARSAVLVTVAGQADPARVFEAIGHGALDAIALNDAADVEALAAVLLPKIAAMARWIGKSGGKGVAAAAADDRSISCHRLIAIGASAGGPAALAVVLGGLPRTLPAGIVVVQHLGEDFTEGVAEWLQRSTTLDVRVAREGDRPAAGTVLVAGGNDHLIFKSPGRLGYSPDPRDRIYRPSIDVFFQSVCRLWRGSAVGVLLTGMGRDGAQGLQLLRAQGCHTIAQDEATCAVYGMPKAAAALNAAVDILPLDRIAGRIGDAVTARVRSRRR